MIARHRDVIGVTRCTITIVTEEGAGAPWAEIVAHTQLLSSLDIDTKRRNKIAACPCLFPRKLFSTRYPEPWLTATKNRTKEN